MADNLEEQLWNIAYQTAKNQELEYSKVSEKHVREFINKGVARIKRERTEKNSEQIKNAEQNLQKFVQEMIDEAKRRKLDLLHEETFHAAMKSLCPIWPFC